MLQSSYPFWGLKVILKKKNLFFFFLGAEFLSANACWSQLKATMQKWFTAQQRLMYKNCRKQRYCQMPVLFMCLGAASLKSLHMVISGGGYLAPFFNLSRTIAYVGKGLQRCCTGELGENPNEVILPEGSFHFLWRLVWEGVRELVGFTCHLEVLQGQTFQLGVFFFFFNRFRAHIKGHFSRMFTVSLLVPCIQF